MRQQHAMHGTLEEPPPAGSKTNRPRPTGRARILELDTAVQETEFRTYSAPGLNVSTVRFG